jgi:2-oxoacid:acceptor oxidoreductase gamma subunit (pyruvate/2-ketoisovalerate family)
MPMLQIRIHGRGGQGGKAASEILAMAAIESGKYAKSFPEFGPERTGAPVQYYLKVSDKEIKTNQPIKEPDIIIVLDDGLIGLVNFTEGLKKDGIIILNTKKTKEELKEKFRDFKIFTVDASKISFDLFQKNLPNVPILGALAKVTKLVELEKLKEEVKNKFSFLPQEILEKNIKALEEGHKQVKQIA